MWFFCKLTCKRRELLKGHNSRCVICISVVIKNLKIRRASQTEQVRKLALRFWQSLTFLALVLVGDLSFLTGRCLVLINKENSEVYSPVTQRYQEMQKRSDYIKTLISVTSTRNENSISPFGIRTPLFVEDKCTMTLPDKFLNETIDCSSKQRNGLFGYLPDKVAIKLPTSR